MILGDCTVDSHEEVDAMDCYQAPRHIDSPNDCYFYHQTEFDELKSQRCEWDLRHCIDPYLGELDYNDQRVLDVGTASGYLTFEMEKRGANVVSFDMPSAHNWDFVPHYKLAENWDQHVEQYVKSQQRLQNAYWYLHKRYNSSARVHYGDVYRLPVELGNFDIVVMGMILGHLRDPFQAIYSASRLCRTTIVITNQMNPEKPRRFWQRKRKKRDPGNAFFMPSANDLVDAAWWGLTTECIERMLGTVGFRTVRTTTSNPKCLLDGRIGHEHCQTLIAQRFAGRPVGIEQSPLRKTA